MVVYNEGDYRAEMNSIKTISHISSREKQSRTEVFKPHASLAAKVK